MKTKLISLAIVVFLMVCSTTAKAQYCFWVANQSTKSFYAVKLRAHGSSSAFKDVLPTDILKKGENCWVKTSSLLDMWDVQITKLSGDVILFTYKDVSGNMHINQRFITVNAKLLHTLIIGEDYSGNLNFAYHTADQLDLGHPCSN